MENSNGNNHDNVDQENPLFRDHHYLRSFDQEFNHSPDLIDPADDDLLVRSLLIREYNGRFDPPGGIPENEKSWVKDYRLWMLKEVVIQSVDDFGLQRYRTAYLAVVYFERLLSKEWRSLKGMDLLIRYLGATCLIHAANVEEGHLPPHLPVVNDAIFSAFRKIEKIVKRKLGARPRLVTPLSFTNFLMRKFEAFPTGNGGNVASRTAAFVFTVMKVIGTLKYRPSVVAAAATLAAIDPNLTRAAIEERIRTIRDSEFAFTASVGDIHRCYSQIKHLDPYQELVFPTP